MFALSATNAISARAVLAARPRASARSLRRAVSVTPRAEGESSADAETKVADAVSAADAEWAEKASEPAAPAAFSAAIDPADGSVAEAAPLGDDLSMLNAAMVAFKTPRAVEIINGRVAMIGWMLALGAELFDDQSLARQVVNTRTFVLADGVERVTQSPAEGMFLVPLVVLLVVAASIAPQVRGEEGKGGLETEPEAFGPFKAESEMTNGRGAMVGLAALFVAEKLFTHGSALL